MLKKTSKQEAIRKLEQFCIYQDRCHKEVHEKLYKLGFNQTERDEIVAYLIENNFLNEERFARNYARGRFYLKKWGKNKIAYELKIKGLNSKLIGYALEEIDEKDYLKTISELIRKKLKTLQKTDHLAKKAAVIRYLTAKGYETHLITEMLEKFED